MELEKQNTNYMVDGYVVSKESDTEEVIHIPYNINNLLVDEHHILEILENNNVKLEKINHIKFFRQAFTHKSYLQRSVFPEHILTCAKNELGNPPNLLELQPISYERLEYLGDRVVKLITSTYLFYRYPEQDEGFMTRLQTKLEDKTNLAEMSKKIGLNKFFIISQQIENLNGRSLEKIHEDVFEAFMGALFLSNGFEPCCLLLVNLLETLIDYSEKLYKDNNYKDILLRYYHSQKWNFPKYYIISQKGPPHKRVYIMGVCNGTEEDMTNKTIKEKCIGYGTGSTKKEGEQNSAKMALIIYGYLKEDQYENSDIYYPDWENIGEVDNNSIDNLYSLNTESKNYTIINNNNLLTLEKDNNLLTLEKSVECEISDDEISNISDETESDC